MLNSRNDADSVFLNITIRLHNDIDLGSELLALLYNDGSSEERVLLGLLSPRKYLFK